MSNGQTETPALVRQLERFLAMAGLSTAVLGIFISAVVGVLAAKLGQPTEQIAYQWYIPEAVRAGAHVVGMTLLLLYMGTAAALLIGAFSAVFDAYEGALLDDRGEFQWSVRHERGLLVGTGLGAVLYVVTFSGVEVAFGAPLVTLVWVQHLHAFIGPVGLVQRIGTRLTF